LRPGYRARFRSGPSPEFLASLKPKDDELSR
jgi:hypothetical protein